jgi:hypothetical protein
MEDQMETNSWCMYKILKKLITTDMDIGTWLDEMRSTIELQVQTYDYLSSTDDYLNATDEDPTNVLLRGTQGLIEDMVIADAAIEMKAMKDILLDAGKTTHGSKMLHDWYCLNAEDSEGRGNENI